MAIEYCPDCGGQMSRIIGYVKADALAHAGEPIRACPSCGYQRDAYGVMSGSYFYDIASKEPPGSEHRCPNCGAYTFNYPSGALGDDSKCRRCGYPSPFVKNQGQRAATIQQPRAQTWPSRSGQAQGYAAPAASSGRGGWNTTFGLVTSGTAVILFILLAIIQPADFIFSIWMFHDLIGFAGGLISLSGSNFGKLLRKIFWFGVPVVIILLLIMGR